jgi:hypothetical protein
MGGISDRHQEIARRRHRKKKLEVFKRKLAKASSTDKLAIAAKIRKMTPGCETIIETLQLEAGK